MNTESRTFSAVFDLPEERRGYSADFKAQVALEAIKGEKSHAEIGLEFAIHPNQVSLWRQQLLNNLNLLFDNDDIVLDINPKIADNRHSKIGQLMAENDFLTKVLGR